MKIKTKKIDPLIKLANPEYKPEEIIQFSKSEFETLKKAYQILVQADSLFEMIHPGIDSRDNPYLRAWIELPYCYPGNIENKETA